jgi:hypothetical protein
MIKKELHDEYVQNLKICKDYKDVEKAADHYSKTISNSFTADALYMSLTKRNKISGHKITRDGTKRILGRSKLFTGKRKRLARGRIVTIFTRV